MVEVQLKDGTFVSINQSMIKELKSNKTKEIIDKKTGRVYNVNDYQTGEEFTVTMIDGSTYILTKLGLDILRKGDPRIDFNPNTLRSVLTDF